MAERNRDWTWPIRNGFMNHAPWSDNLNSAVNGTYHAFVHLGTFSLRTLF